MGIETGPTLIKQQNQSSETPNHERERNRIRDYLREYFNTEQKGVERIELMMAKDLPQHYQAQYEALNDKRLENVTIAVVPDDLWSKGQPSESAAERKLVLFKQSYFEARENPDEIAWLSHELAHCQNFLDVKSAEKYQANMQTFAFPDLESKHTYPNNPVEQYAFTRQFQYLKKQGKSREDVLEMLSASYAEEDSPFFNRLLDNVYG